MSVAVAEQTIQLLRQAITPLRGAENQYDRLVERVGRARVVLLGEASHGTREFYRARAEITRRLILEQGFMAVALEADWPDAFRVHRYVRGELKGETADQALGAFQRFPSWMWRNREVLAFLEWLAGENQKRKQKVGFFGLDLYSLNRSRAEVIRYLERTDSGAAKRARERYACFDHHGEDPEEYGYAATVDAEHSCEIQVMEQLRELQKRGADFAGRIGKKEEEEYFSAEQNARLVKDAEEYYRSMFRGRTACWNLRDRHMADTLAMLSERLEKTHGSGRIVVWEHNKHVGDARGTERTKLGEWNLGQLVRERYPNETAHIGFTTYQGTVTAASEWDGETLRKTIPPALAGSYEALFHELGEPNFLLPIRTNEAVREALKGPMLERAIGVVYRPEKEQTSHYFQASLPDQFDAIIHFDHTTAVEPLPALPSMRDDMPETYPSGL